MRMRRAVMKRKCAVRGASKLTRPGIGQLGIGCETFWSLLKVILSSFGFGRTDPRMTLLETVLTCSTRIFVFFCLMSVFVVRLCSGFYQSSFRF